MTAAAWAVVVIAIIGLLGGGALLVLSRRGDPPFEVPRPVPYVVLVAAAILFVVALLQWARS